MHYDNEQIKTITYKYEDLREAVRIGTANRQMGLNMVLSQGLWAWIQLVTNELPTQNQTLRAVSKPFSTENIQPLVSRPSVLGVLTDLLVGRLTAQEGI